MVVASAPQTPVLPSSRPDVVDARAAVAARAGEERSDGPAAAAQEAPSRPEPDASAPQTPVLPSSRPGVVDARAAVAARAGDERSDGPAAAAQEAPPARPEPEVSAPQTPVLPSSRPPGLALQQHQSNVPILRQPGDALLVESKLATHRPLAERHARRDQGKLQSPVGPNDDIILLAHRAGIEDELGRPGRPM